MRKWLSGAIVAALIGVGMILGSAALAQRQQRVTVVGDVVDLVGLAMRGQGGDYTAEAMKFRVEHGFPVGLIEEESGAVYLVVYRDPAPAAHLETANKTLLPFVGKKVAAQGRIYEGKGYKVLEVAIVGEY